MSLGNEVLLTIVAQDRGRVALVVAQVLEHLTQSRLILERVELHLLLQSSLRGASRFGPNGLEFDKETTHFIVRWTRVASMA